MKGLYVYGALCMALSFVVGMHTGHPLIMAGALAACAIAALSEAASEVISVASQAGPSLVAAQAVAAILSWIMTAATVLGSLYVLIGGA